MVWTQVSSDVFPSSVRPTGIYYRPKIVFNKRTAKYVLWINYLAPANTPLQAYPNASYLVATAMTPHGPFQLVTKKAKMSFTGGGDFTIFVDSANPNHSAYIAYDAWENSHRVSIEALNADYTDSSGNSTGAISPSGNEAPILFQRHGFYYLLFGHTCCFCEQGAGSNIYTAKHPLGPWEDGGYDINGKKSVFGDRTIKAQENYVFEVPHAEDNTITFVYTGDRWDSAPDDLKSHDYQYWEPLHFNDSVTPPVIAPLTFVGSFVIKA